jgi:hypothetical protein
MIKSNSCQQRPRDPGPPRASFIRRDRIKRYAAAQTGIVSGGELWPSQRELSRHLKYIVRTWLAQAFSSSSPPTPATESSLCAEETSYRRGSRCMTRRGSSKATVSGGYYQPNKTAIIMIFQICSPTSAQTVIFEFESYHPSHGVGLFERVGKALSRCRSTRKSSAEMRGGFIVFHTTKTQSGPTLDRKKPRPTVPCAAPPVKRWISSRSRLANQPASDGVPDRVRLPGGGQVSISYNSAPGFFR